jgi:beta-lactam-binding protein with PASTA domain/serine/threonine protein kinase
VAVSRSTDQIGRVLSGRYRLIAGVGTGASAQVFLADDVRLKRRVAVKVLHEGLADDESFLRRFRAEAQAAAALNHPNIVAVYDWGEDDGTPYLVTEYLGGGTLRTMLDRGSRLSPSQALLVGLQATRALDYAHRRGFVHRDVKPANLLFGEDGRLRIADFGLARALAEAAWTEPQGAVLGTARYASPEQAQGEAVDGRADVYSLGLVLIESVTGTVPFAADTTIATLMARVGRPVEVPEAMGPLRRALERAGAPVAADRPDASELGVALMATANELPRPEPLTLAVGEPTIAGVVLDDEVTNLTRSPDDGDLDLTVGLDAIDDLPEEWEEDRHRRRWPWVVLAILLAAAIGGGAAWYWNDARTPSFEVPRLLNLSEQRAREAVSQYGWRIETVEERKDGSEPGTVLATDPPPGESLREGGTLELTISLGNTLARVPQDLVGKPLAEAQAALQQAGGFTVAVTQQFDETVPADTVIALGPDVPAEVPKGGEVALVVSQGPEPRKVPDGMSGGTFEEAKAKLEAVGLKAKKVDEFHDTITPGKVISSRPGPGTEVPRDSEVEVLVSKGPDVVKVPSVSGLTLDQATAAIERAGLTVGEVFGPANGRPFDTNPSPGTTVKRGTTVDIYLRR